jgi:hypothetical protein
MRPIAGATILNAARESRPDVGSSRKSNSSGLLASSTAMVSRLPKEVPLQEKYDYCETIIDLLEMRPIAGATVGSAGPEPADPTVAPAIGRISSKSMIVSQ